ncbi:MAG: TraB/GumN family protein [Burkholderiales bacterium]
MSSLRQDAAHNPSRNPDLFAWVCGTPARVFLAAGTAVVALSLGAQSPAPAPVPMPPAATASSPERGAAEARVAKDYDPTLSREVRVETRSDNLRALLWEVKSPQGNIVYLFGTIHVGKPSFYPLPTSTQLALRQSAKIVVEADVTDQSDAAELEKLMQYPAGKTLDSVLPESLLTRLKLQLEKRRISYAAMRSMKPVIIGGMIPIVDYMRLGYDMKYGLDLWLIEHAKREKKPLLQLESQLGQLQLMSNMPDALQEAFLDNALRTIEQDRTAEAVTGIVNAWQSGDPVLLQDLVSQASQGMRLTERLDDYLLHARHPDMLKKIESYLASGEIHFVAVGSLHLVGPRGLVALLRQKGYAIKQL